MNCRLVNRFLLEGERFWGTLPLCIMGATEGLFPDILWAPDLTNMHESLWQWWVENEHCSVLHFERVTAYISVGTV